MNEPVVKLAKQLTAQLEQFLKTCKAEGDTNSLKIKVFTTILQDMLIIKET